MAVIPLTFRDLLCSLLLLLKVTVVLFWLGLSTPQDFIGSSLILSNLLLIDRLATPVDPRMDSNALLCLIFGGRVMQALCFFLLSIFSRSFYSLTVQFFQVLRSFSGLPLSLGYSVLSCLTAVAWTTIGLLVMIEACQASRPGAGRGGILHPRMLLRSARIATFCCFMVSLLFPCFFLVSLSLSLFSFCCCSPPSRCCSRPARWRRPTSSLCARRCWRCWRYCFRQTGIPPSWDPGAS